MAFCVPIQHYGLNLSHIGGVAGLMLCLFAKFREWWDKRKENNREVMHNNLTYCLHEDSNQLCLFLSFSNMLV